MQLLRDACFPNEDHFEEPEPCHDDDSTSVSTRTRNHFSMHDNPYWDTDPSYKNPADFHSKTATNALPRCGWRFLYMVPHTLCVCC